MSYKNELKPLTDKTYDYYRPIITEGITEFMVNKFGENNSVSNMADCVMKRMFKEGDNDLISDRLKNTKKSIPYSKLTSEESFTLLKVLNDEYIKTKDIGILTNWVIIFIMSNFDVNVYGITPQTNHGIPFPTLDDIYSGPNGWYYKTYTKANNYRHIKLNEEIKKILDWYIKETEEVRGKTEYLFMTKSYNYTPMNAPAFYLRIKQYIIPLMKSHDIARGKKIVQSSFKGASFRINGNINSGHYERVS